MKTQEEKFTGLRISGVPMLLLNILVFIAIWYCLYQIVEHSSPSYTGILVVIDLVFFVINSIFWIGFMMIEPNEARVLVFFGKYKGTVKENGYFWVNPFYVKKKMTLRARNLDAEPIKVNDKRGNPIMIGQVIVWRVTDTYKASFSIDSTAKTTQTTIGSNLLADKMKSYEYFVKVQSDAALRNVAGMYAYDHLENEEDRITLRSGGQEINDFLEKQLNERLCLAGIEIMEARINYLAYAPEIAAVMLRRQQADAIIAAREKIVDGAVGMVKMAIKKLADEEVIVLDDDKKAAMVSNLMVVLCSDEPAQPIINSGTLYN